MPRRRDDDSRSPNIHNIKELVVPPPEPPSTYQDASADGPKSHLYTIYIYNIIYARRPTVITIVHTHVPENIHIFPSRWRAHFITNRRNNNISRILLYVYNSLAHYYILYKNNRHHCCVMRTVILCVYDRATVCSPLLSSHLGLGAIFSVSHPLTLYTRIVVSSKSEGHLFFHNSFEQYICNCFNRK